MAIKALVFDAYGTLYDAHSVYTKTEELCPGKGDLISEIWRLKQLEYTWLQTSLLEYRDFGFLTRGVARIWLRAAGGKSSEPITGLLFDKYLDLAPYPGRQGCPPRVDESRRLQTGYPVKRWHRHAISAGEEFRTRRLP
jgi:2-haloacid dehalogenase